MNKVLVIGSVSKDMTTYVKRIPKSGETYVGTSFSTCIGGKGANQAVTIKKMAGEVNFFCSVGNDENGQQVKKLFQELELPAIYKMSDKNTGIATILVETSSGQNRIAIVPGANHDITTFDIDKIDCLFKECQILLVQLEIPMESLIYVIKKAYDNEMIIVLNPAPASQIPLEIYPLLDYLIPNENEINLLIKGGKSFEDKMHRLLDYGVKNVILTLGKNGSIYMNKEETVHIKPFKVKAVDTTAAGDCFVGSFVSQLSKENDIIDALNFASKASAISVTKKGAINSLPLLEEVLDI